MRIELSSFQSKAVRELHSRAIMAHDSYGKYHVPQVISLQAPTGSGKTVMLAALIENIYYGTEEFAEQPGAIFVWLSDSPALNEQSMQKIIRHADRIMPGRCEMISDESFDRRTLDDGHIYFLNTQKIGKSGNLVRHSDMRQYTIWETIENTANEKPGQLYFVIDEAHRGMQGRDAGKATTIMQKFIKGSPADGLSPVPVIIGMSATAARFESLVAGNTSSTLNKVVVSPAEVRYSGLLKDRIIINYPQDSSRRSDMAVLHAAVDEWRGKCEHWKHYTDSQNEEDIKPVLLIQVSAGSGDRVSSTNLDDVIAKIEERLGESLREKEVAHTFGGTGTLTINGLKVHHVDPDKISDDMRIRVVLFKENLSTGWDCPRAETMMSFRHAEDSTYIAQLLGRMIRTPLQRHIEADDSLNEVRLFLPYFDRDTVQGIIDGLQSEEGGELPADVDGEEIGGSGYVIWTPYTKPKTNNATLPGQIEIVLDDNMPEAETVTATPSNAAETPAPTTPSITQPCKKPSEVPPAQIDIPGLTLDRSEIIRFINAQGYLTYTVRNTRVNSYLKSLLSLSALLTRWGIYQQSDSEIKREVTDMIREHAEGLRRDGKYASLARDVTEFRLSSKVYDALGGEMGSFGTRDIFCMSESDLDRRMREADVKMGNYGFTYAYGKRYGEENRPDEYKIDCILFANDEHCAAMLNRYAEDKFHELDDKYRVYLASKSESCRSQYDEIKRDGECVSSHNFRLPEDYRAKRDDNGRNFTNHLFADTDGNARISLNGWEEELIDEESGRSDFVCWLRNPPRQAWSLCVPYVMDRENRALYPDFLIVRRDSRLGYIVDILEPHNPGFTDNLGKAKGLAKYAVKESRISRVQLIRKGRDVAGRERFLRLDMSRGAVRDKVLSAVNNEELDYIFNASGEFI